MREPNPYFKKSTLEGRARGARPDPPPCMYWNEQGGACPLPGVTGAAGTHEASPASAEAARPCAQRPAPEGFAKCKFSAPARGFKIGATKA